MSMQGMHTSVVFIPTPMHVINYVHNNSVTCFSYISQSLFGLQTLLIYQKLWGERWIKEIGMDCGLGLYYVCEFW